MQHSGMAKAAPSSHTGPTGTAGPLASGMLACFGDAPELMGRQVDLLAEAERGIDETRRADPRSPASPTSVPSRRPSPAVSRLVTTGSSPTTSSSAGPIQGPSTSA